MTAELDGQPVDDEPDDELVEGRAAALGAAEVRAGTDDAVVQARAILDESDERAFTRDHDDDVERRRSEETVTPTEPGDSARSK